MTVTGVGYQPEAWASFAVAEVGAAAALAGLLVVAASINIAKIIEIPGIVSRPASTLALFTGVLVACSAVLVPGLDNLGAGIAIAAVGVILTALVVRFRGLNGVDDAYRRSALRMDLAAVGTTLLLTWTGVSCAVGVGGGLYWLAPGVVAAFATGLVNAWVALVEILR